MFFPCLNKKGRFQSTYTLEWRHLLVMREGGDNQDTSGGGGGSPNQGVHRSRGAVAASSTTSTPTTTPATPPGPSGTDPPAAAISSMPAQSMMSGGGVHLQQDPTSTTPEGGSFAGGGGSGGGQCQPPPSFLSLDHPPPPHSHSHHHQHLHLHSPMGGGGEVHGKQEVVAGSSTPAKLCQVCSDNASGFHYGVWSCEGCKAFFKRSIQGPVDYMCPATNTCTIDKHRRKSCQACRLRRCYEVGMNKGSQRKERKSSVSSSGAKGGKRCRPDSTDALINSTNGASTSKVARRLHSDSILEALQKADMPALESYHDHQQPLSKVHLLNTLIKLADRELVYLINWAKHVPGYTDLSLGDQVHLIECCWMELLLLNCAFRSMEYQGQRLVVAPDFHLDKSAWVVMEMGDILEQVCAVSDQMVQLSVTKEELLLLQATVLVNAEVRKLSSSGRIAEMQRTILDALIEVTSHHHDTNTSTTTSSSSSSNSRRVPTLLLLLTHIRQAGQRGVAFFHGLKQEGCVTFCDLLTEMLDAHNVGSVTNCTTAAASTTTTTGAAPSPLSSSSAVSSMPSTVAVSMEVVDRKTVNPSSSMTPFPPGPSSPPS